MRADLHTHTSWSDGTSSATDMVRAAAEAGLDAMALTDHLTLPDAMDPHKECSVAEADLPSLAREARQAALAFPIDVFIGFECDWYPGCEKNIERWASGADLLLGSVHWIGDPSCGAWIDDPGDLRVWEELGPDEVWRRYCDAWCAACESPAAFDSMAHPDLPFRFAHEGFAPTCDLSPVFCAMAECAHDTGRRIEVSTAGLRKGVGAFYPCPDLLDSFVRAEVPVTFGSDAHRAYDVGWGLEKAYTYAWKHGVRAQEILTRDGWRSVPL